MKRILVLIFALMFTASASHGQRVGVVFSGGGAKGLYHIGILKALEENGIPIDYISGTSMGAIVAGLYAIGYTPDEMAELFLSGQVKLWMSGRIESEYSFYFNRMQPRQDIFTLNLDFQSEKNIAVLPTNLVPSTQIDMAFNEIFATSTALSGGDFNKLFVPFRCIASDVYNKREVVYRQGDIGRAIRASMTIPMVFKPLKADSILLYDGGIFNNFPWQVLEEDFQPDVFIGGKCVQGVKNPDESSIVEQIEAITMMHTDFNLPENQGIMINRVFDDVGMLDFGRAQYIMEIGYADAMEMMDSIRGRIPRREDPQALLNKRLTYRAALPELVFNDYQVEGLTDSQSQYVRQMLGLDDEQMRSFDYQQFKSSYFKILSEGEIIGDYPEMTYNDSSGYFSVLLPLRTKPSFRLKFGGNISSAALNQAYIGLEYKTVARNAHSIRFDGNFSGLYTAIRTGWRTDFYFNSPVYFDLIFNYNKYNYQKGPNWSTFQKYGYHSSQDIFLSSSLGIPLGLSSVLQVRFNLGKDRFDYFEREWPPREYGSSDRTRFNYYGFQLESTTRTLNYSLFPTRGIFQSVSVIFVNGKESFAPGENYVEKDENGDPVFVDDNSIAIPGRSAFTEKENRRWVGAQYMREEYIPINSWLTLGYMIDAVATTRPDFYTERGTNFVSPGFTPTPYSQSLYMDKFRSWAYLGAGVLPIIEFNDNFYLKNSFHLFASGDYLFRQTMGSREKLRYIFNSSLVYQTPIGPASLTLTNFEETSRKWFVVLNFGFTLFNKRGLFY